MDLGALFVSLVCFVAGGVLLVLSAWFRWGRSRIARWWVRRVPVEQMGYRRSASEAVALGVTPFCAQLTAAIGIVELLRIHPGVRDLLHAPAMWTMVVGETVLAVIVMVAISNRYILPLPVYPAWLRPQRRADRVRINGLR